MTTRGTDLLLKFAPVRRTAPRSRSGTPTCLLGGHRDVRVQRSVGAWAHRCLRAVLKSRTQRTREAVDEDDESEAFTEADLFPVPMPEGPAQPVPEPAVVDDGHPDVWVEPTNVDPSGSQWLEYPSGSDRWYYRYADGEPWIDYNG